MNAIKSRYPKSTLLLCWWHVLHAWQQHFVVSSFPALWDVLKKWIRITDPVEFWEYWSEIKSLAPKSMIKYLQSYWLESSMIPLWSAVYRNDRTIFQQCDTNMLVEAWHHLLKGNFMEGKRNRRLDHLIYILINQAIPFFIQRHWRQEFGFEGGDLEVEERLRIESCAKSIKIEDITAVADEDKVYYHVSGVAKYF